MSASRGIHQVVVLLLAVCLVIGGLLLVSSVPGSTGTGVSPEDCTDAALMRLGDGVAPESTGGPAATIVPPSSGGSTTSSVEPTTTIETSTSEPTTTGETSTSDPTTTVETSTSEPTTTGETSTSEPTTTGETSTSETSTSEPTSTTEPCVPCWEQPPAPAPAPSEDDTLKTYARDTWCSLVRMTDNFTGLPADNIDGAGRKSSFTSPTNIGAYMWSTLAAQRLGIITAAQARARLSATLDSLDAMEYHLASGQFYNWYDPATRRPTWPPTAEAPGVKFLSSVDNGWLATALLMVKNAGAVVGAPLAQQADRLYQRMNFGFYYDQAQDLLRNGAWTTRPDPNRWPTVEDRGVWWKAGGQPLRPNIYGELNTEPRMAAYIAIARGQVPRTLYFRLLRTPPPAVTSQEMTPQGPADPVDHLGVPVFEGHYQYNFFSQAAGAWLGIQVVPSHGGSMFEALMVPLFIPEERWGPDSWGRNHRCYVQAQIDHGMTEAAYGYWGFSPSNDPFGGYREWGVDAIGIDQGEPQLGAPKGGYFSDKQNTGFNYGLVPPTQPQAANFGNGVVTPHASFLAMRLDRASAVANLAKLRRDFPAVYAWGGFYDAIDVKGGRISQYYLSLDQGMIMAAIADVLTADDYSRPVWTDPQIAIAVPSLLQRETFSIEAYPRCVVD